MGTLEAVALALAELGEAHAEAPLLSALRVACEAHEGAEVRASSPELLEKRRAKRERQRAQLHRRVSSEAAVARQPDRVGADVCVREGMRLGFITHKEQQR